MPGFGAYNPFPRSFGGGTRPLEAIHETLRKDYSGKLDVEADGIGWLESYAEAAVLANGDAGARRIGNQLVPTKMMEALPVWERITKIRVGRGAKDPARRRELAAKFKGYLNNSEPYIRDACETLMGINFSGLSWVSDSDDVTYWPGINPGPPGADWYSRRAIAMVEVNRTGLSQDEFVSKTGKLGNMLNDLLPVWMSFYIYVLDSNGTEDGFILDASLLDITGLGE